MEKFFDYIENRSILTFYIKCKNGYFCIPYLKKKEY